MNGKNYVSDGNIPEDGETEEEARAAYARLVETESRWHL